MSNKIALSADSTCDLSASLKEQYNVSYYPYYVRFRGKDYKDNVDIFPQDLYDGYYEDGSLPQTAASNINEYMDHFKQFTDKGMEVIHISLGSALSSGYDNAAMAAENMEGVYVIDGANLSTGLGQIVIRVGRMIEQGMSATEIVEHAEKIKGHVHSSFVLSTLDFMAAGGRCPAVAAKAAGMLKCRPSLEVDNSDGSLHMAKMYRGKTEKVAAKYIAEQLTKYDDIVTDDIFLTTANDFSEQTMDFLKTEILKHVKFDRIHTSLASCTIASHCGPDCFGILFVTNYDKS